jgi:hypothetical protein
VYPVYPVSMSSTHTYLNASVRVSTADATFKTAGTGNWTFNEPHHIWTRSLSEVQVSVPAAKPCDPCIDV